MNIALIAEQLAYIELTIDTDDEFDVYGGTTRAGFEFERVGTAQWHITVRESEVAGAPLRTFDIYARQRSTGREWVVLSGRIMVKPRTADIEGDKLSPVEYHVTVPVVDSVVDTQGMAIVTGIPGPQGPKGEKGDPGDGNVTAEAIQAVAPIAWSNYTTGKPTVSGTFSYAIGNGASVFGNGSICVGSYSSASGTQNIVLGYDAHAEKNSSVSIGGRLTDSSGNTLSNTSQAPQTVVIGNGAQILNGTDANGNTVQSSNSVAIGTGAINKGADSVALGAQAKAAISAAISIGAKASAFQLEAIAIGKSASANWKAVAIGANTSTSSASIAIGNTSATQQYGVAIGYGAKITRTGDIDSTNSTVIGYGASASAPNAVVMGAGASCSGGYSAVIGQSATAHAANCIAILGRAAKAGSQAIGVGSSAEGITSTAIGHGAIASKEHSIAIGYNAKSSNIGAVVFASYDSANRNYKTQLYFSGAGSTLANTYENGEAMMGYVVTDKDGNKVVAGTQKLSVLFPNNSTFQPATVDENGEWVMPKVFHPADLDIPIEEPTEDVEINIPEPEVEEYQPLPVYPIVEPEMPAIDWVAMLRAEFAHWLEGIWHEIRWEPEENRLEIYTDHAEEALLEAIEATANSYKPDHVTLVQYNSKPSEPEELRTPTQAD